MIKENLVLARQKASKAIGQNFYVTKQGIKRDYDLNKSEYEFKIYATSKGIYIEDSKGKFIEKPKTRVSRKMRDTSNEVARKDGE